MYGPGATLFTLGRNNTAQQFDLNSPSQLVANVQHPANLLPPSPPISIEEQKKQNAGAAPSGEASEVPINVDVSESDEDHMSPLARIAREMDKMEAERSGKDTPDREGTLSPVSSRSRTSSHSRSSANSSNSRNAHQYRKQASVVSRGLSDGTTMSVGSSLHSTREPSILSSRDSYSMGSVSGQSYGSARSRPRGSRLRQEVLRSPDDVKIVDLFKFTKSRLSDIPYRHPQVLDNTHLTNSDLRRQMLSTIFGWTGEADALVKDEMSRHPLGSPNRLLLSKWLGEVDIDIMSTSSEAMTSSDWMLLALSGIGGHASQQKVARAYVQRLLEKGDVHTAATIMIGMGDQNDAIEIYVSHKRYMEALILTCLVFPSDWQRQAELIRKWGEWAVQHSQQQLAIRCFSCTGSESSEPWVSPTAQAATFSQLQSQSIPEILSPPLSPPGARGPQRSIAKTSALKLITSFGGDSGKAKFFGIGDDERTPIGGGVTPIAESALSPAGSDTAHTAFLRPGHRSAYHTPQSARTATPGGFTRQRLPSIGEMPSDVLPRKTLQHNIKPPTPADSGSDKEKSDGLLKIVHERKVSQPETLQLNSATYTPIGRPQTASPMLEKASMQRKISGALPSPSPESFTAQKRDARTRNGSRDRKPDGLHIQWPPMESIITGDYMTSSPETSAASSKYRGAPTRSHAGSASAASLSAASFSTTATRSPNYSESSYKSFATASPIVQGKSLDQYISSLDTAQHFAEKAAKRQASRERQARARSASRKAKGREASEDRGRSAGRYIKPAKRSPTSPVPMSPEDLVNLGAVGYGDEAGAESRRVRDTSRQKKSSSKARQPSPGNSRILTGSKPHSRVNSRNNSRRPSPDTRLTLIDTSRGRSKGREGSVLRSPSSPLPMSPQHKFYQEDDESHDLRNAQAEQDRFRPRNRSGSRRGERGTSAIREPSPDRRRPARERSESRQRAERDSSRTRRELSLQAVRDRLQHNRSASGQAAAEIDQKTRERNIKKEQAARELEERRKSLARRPSVPPIVHPEDLVILSPVQYQRPSIPDFSRSQTFPAGPSQHTPRSNTTSPAPLQTSQPYLRESATGSSVSVGLPATPRAMRHPKFDPENKDVPDVPQIPLKYDQAPSHTWTSPNLPSSAGSFGEIAPLLPKTTYSAAPRRIPPRSASAPIPEEPMPSPYALPAALPLHPAFHANLPASNRRKTQDASAMSTTRKINPGEAQPGTLGYGGSRNTSPVYQIQSGPMGGIEETIQAGSQPFQHSSDNLTPPPPPPVPAPPMLKELQHLAMPPPPPPAPIAPLYRPANNNTNSIVSGVSSGSGVIEIVMDDDEDKSDIPVIDVSSLPTPGFQRSSTISHNRGRSENDSSFSGRFTRAAERLRSASRGRATSPLVDRTTSPREAPYESVPLWSPSRTPVATPGSVTERHPREVKAAMEGGMI